MAEPIGLSGRERLTFRDPSRRPLARLVARGLIQLLLVGMLPPEWQVRAALWPAYALFAVETLEDRLIGLASVSGHEGAPATGLGLPARDSDEPLAIGGEAGAPSGGGEEGEDGRARLAQPRSAASKDRPAAVWARHTGHGDGVWPDRHRSGHGLPVAVSRDTCTCTAPAACDGDGPGRGCSSR